MRRRMQFERGAALLEAAVTIPLLLLLAVGAFEFGRLYQTWQILTNAAREGARMAVLPNSTDSSVDSRVRQYIQDGQLPNHGSAGVTIDRNATIMVNGNSEPATNVTVSYPFQFMVLQPVAQLVVPNSTAGTPLTMGASSLMRNETP